MTYKKRAKGNWCGGKEYKKESNRTERRFSKKEVVSELQEDFEGDSFRYRIPTKTIRTPEQKLENSIRWYDKILRSYENRDFGAKGYFLNDILNRFRSSRDKLVQKLADLKKK